MTGGAEGAVSHSALKETCCETDSIQYLCPSSSVHLRESSTNDFRVSNVVLSDSDNFVQLGDSSTGVQHTVSSDPAHRIDSDVFQSHDNFLRLGDSWSGEDRLLRDSNVFLSHSDNFVHLRDSSSSDPVQLRVSDVFLSRSDNEYAKDLYRAVERDDGECFSSWLGEPLDGESKVQIG